MLLQIEDDKSLAVQVEVEETRRGALCDGQHVEIALPDGSVAPLAGTVKRIVPLVFAPASVVAPQPQPGPGHLFVTVMPDRRIQSLFAGEQVMVRFETCHS